MINYSNIHNIPMSGTEPNAQIVTDFFKSCYNRQKTKKGLIITGLDKHRDELFRHFTETTRVNLIRCGTIEELQTMPKMHVKNNGSDPVVIIMHSDLVNDKTSGLIKEIVGTDGIIMPRLYGMDEHITYPKINLIIEAQVSNIHNIDTSLQKRFDIVNIS